MSHYTHISIEEREIIRCGLAEKKSKAAIARELGRNRSSISRELQRNKSTHHTYSAHVAQHRYVKRRKRCHRKYVLENKEWYAYVMEGLSVSWSPEEIVGRWELKKGEKSPSCATSIYRAIHTGLIPVVVKKAMRTNWSRKKHKREKGKDPRGRIAIEHTIHDRPGIANHRERLGDWEADTVRSSKRGGIATYVDRKSRLLIAKKVADLKADSFNAATVEALGPWNAMDCVKTLTVDNGHEFARYKEIEKKFGELVVYFAEPFSSWQRGSNEHANGLLRQFYPKGTDFDDITQAELDAVVDLINQRPRKMFNYLSAHEEHERLLRKHDEDAKKK